MFSGVAMPAKLWSMNAYLGAFPIAQALASGADIVLTGRCVDSALVLGPLIHEFQWAADDSDRLSAGRLAGHIIERRDPARNSAVTGTSVSVRVDLGGVQHSNKNTRTT